MNDINDLAYQLADLHADGCESMGAAYYPSDAWNVFEASTLIVSLREAGLRYDAEGVEALRVALEDALREALERVELLD